ncbi:MAG: hypothetical protein ING06_14505 [Roseomonas sp.]|nr:hypothetical protein [Roseomonas sp.]
MPRDFAEVINLWRSATELAIALDVEAVTVRAWRRRGIPAHQHAVERVGEGMERGCAYG